MYEGIQTKYKEVNTMFKSSYFLRNLYLKKLKVFTTSSYFLKIWKKLDENSVGCLIVQLISIIASSHLHSNSFYDKFSINFKSWNFFHFIRNRKITENSFDSHVQFRQTQIFYFILQQQIPFTMQSNILDQDIYDDQVSQENLQSMQVSISQFLNLNDDNKLQSQQQISKQFIIPEQTQINQNKHKVKQKVLIQKNGQKNQDLKNRIQLYNINPQTSCQLKEYCRNLFGTKDNIVFTNNEILLEFYQFKTQISKGNQQLVKLCLILAKYFIYITLNFQQQELENFIKQADLIQDIEQSLSQTNYEQIFELVDQFLSSTEVPFNNYKQQIDEWAKLFKSQLCISKGYIKSHNCNYKIYVDANQEQQFNEKWYNLRKTQFEMKEDQNLRKVDQSKVKKQNFLELINQELQVKTNIGRFTIIEHFKLIISNKNADPLLYLDDIFNVIIKIYFIFLKCLLRIQQSQYQSIGQMYDISIR
ncbi:hypothetical protein pb186bvf_002707 [Paramecium bursaria]